jgi:hypothetical protein
MPTRVRFRLNKLTGEVEEFLIDDQDRRLSEADHDRIALAVAQALERRPLISEVETVAESAVESVPVTEPTDRETAVESPDQATLQRTDDR